MNTLLNYKDYQTFKSYIKESSEHMFDEDPGVDFDEHWEKLSHEDDAYKYVLERLPQYNGNRKIVLTDVFKVESGHYVAYIYGGENGPGNWVDYSKYLNDLFISVPESWIIDLINDCPDDVWTLRLGYDIKEKGD